MTHAEPKETIRNVQEVNQSGQNLLGVAVFGQRAIPNIQYGSSIAYSKIDKIPIVAVNGRVRVVVIENVSL